MFQVNTLNYYKQANRTPLKELDLDGLVPNMETAVAYDKPPIVQYVLAALCRSISPVVITCLHSHSTPFYRHEDHMQFPDIKGRGIFIVQLTGNGMSW